MLDIQKKSRGGGGLTAPPKLPAGRVPRCAWHTMPHINNSHPLYDKILDPPLIYVGVGGNMLVLPTPTL